MKKILFFLFIVFSFSTRICAQALVIDSTRFVTGNQCCTEIRYAIPTSDKGILLVGDDDINPGGIIPYFPLDTVLENVLICKIDSNHQISWIKVYGGSREDGAVSACQTPDGGYAVLASTSSSDGDVTGFKGGSDIWLLRIDSMGNLLWEKTYGSDAGDGAMSIANTLDRGFILLGSSNGTGGDIPFHYGGMFSQDWVVIKTDSLGNKQWCKDIGGTGDEKAAGSILSIDNNYYLISSTNSNDHDCTDSAWHSGIYAYDDYYVLKLDDTGKVLWDSSYGGSNDDEISYAFFDVRDSSIAIAGTTSSDDHMVTGSRGNGDMWVLKINKNGAVIWHKTLGSSQAEEGTGICAALNGGYVMYGSTTTITGVPDPTIGDIGNKDCWLFALDNAGNEMTNKIFGGINIDAPSAIVPLPHGYAATGYSLSTVFTEGSCNVNHNSAFVSYLDYWPVAVNEISKSKFALSTYPNPSQDEVHIETPENENGEIIIINGIGQITYTEKVRKNYADVDIHEWASGLYLIMWQGEDGTELTSKLIKN